MGAGHLAVGYVEGDSRLHGLAPQCKVAAAGLFILAVVATPREQFWAFAGFGLIVAVVARIGHLPLTTVARRLVIEAPFVAFALLLPFIAQGPRVDLGVIALSSDGLWGAWNILAKATLGLGTSIVLVSTTRVTALLDGLERLRVPRAFTTVAGFMVRYIDVVIADMARMNIARQSRGHDPRWIWQARAVAQTAGALFIRCYERGERVHLAMRSRGYAGTMPAGLSTPVAAGADWCLALVLPLTGATIAALAWAV